MRHDLTKLEVLRLTIKEIKYYFDIDTNREFLKRVGYTSPTYLSDIFAGKTTISDKFIAKLGEVFKVNPEAFSGESCDMFSPDSPIQIRITADGRTERALQKDLHIHYGNNSAIGGGVAGDHCVTHPTTGADCVERVAQMHAETVEGFREAIALNAKALQEMAEQRQQLQSSILDEMRAQREMFMKLLDMMNRKNDQQTT